MKSTLNESGRADLRRVLAQMESSAPLAPDLEMRETIDERPRPTYQAVNALVGVAVVAALILPVALFLSMVPSASDPAPVGEPPVAPSTTIDSPPVASTTSLPESGTTNPIVSDEEKTWLHEEMARFLDDVAESGRVVGYIAYGEPRCMQPLLPSSSDVPVGNALIGTARWFLGDRSERVELDKNDPASDMFNPEWEPTHWAVAIVLTFRDETWEHLPPSDQAAEVVRVEAASFSIEPVVRPEACAVIERIDVTERFLPLIPRAFEIMPTG